MIPKEVIFIDSMGFKIIMTFWDSLTIWLTNKVLTLMNYWLKVKNKYEDLITYW